MKHHTQSQSTFTFYLIKPCQPFNQWYTYGTSTTHNQTTFSLSLYISIVIFHTTQSYGQQQLRILLKAIPNFSLTLTEAGIIKHAGTRACCHGQMHNTHTHTCARVHTHTHRGKLKTDYSVAGEGMTKRAASGPLRMFCHHVVTKRARVAKRAGCATDLTRFVTLVTKLDVPQHCVRVFSGVIIVRVGRVCLSFTLYCINRRSPPTVCASSHPSSVEQK